MIKILDMKRVSENEIFLRGLSEPDVFASVAEIIAEVRARGDAAVLDFTEKFDGVRPASLELAPEEWDSAVDSVEPEFMDILREAAENIRAYHSCQLKKGYEIREENGVILGQKLTPLARVGLYIPGGTASYPSSVLMNCIPAKLAGVGEIIMVTPPDKNGGVNACILAAAKVAGVDRIIKCGGAQAVAALAYGTESIPRADKIVGPGNVFVAEAKRQVYGAVDIDMIAGPSEILVISDEKTSPVVLAADMLSQAEHDKMATAVLITTDAKLAERTAEELERQLSELPREEIARASIENNGKIIIADSIEKAIELSNRIAPEHLELCVDDPFNYLDLIENAGSIFLGRSCPEPLGDYFAGTNHTLPTGGRARFSSPLSVDDFVKKSSYTYYTEEALNALCDKIAGFARREGLEAHARSATIRKRLKGGN